ncbi:hypothetical protein RFI_38127, partial [Reticulomyxa filosa]
MITTSVSIEEVTQCFDICYNCFPDKVLACTEFLDLCINNRSKIHELATNENLCNPEYFENTMETLDNCRDMKFQGLVSALRMVCDNFHTKIWDVHFQSMSDLACAILALPSSHNEFVVKFSAYCNEDLSRISFYVEEAGNLQNQQSFDFIHAAMERGYWTFATCEQVLQFYTHKSNQAHTSLDTKDFLLHVDNTTMDYEKLERNIDRVLLGYSREHLKKAKKLVKRLEICKEISSYRIEFWQKGGKKEHEVTKLQTKEKTQVFRNKKLEWQQRLQKWNTTRMSLREKYPSLNYFCFCELRLLIKKLDDILLSDQSLWELHASRHIVPLLQRLDHQYSNGLTFLQEWKKVSISTALESKDQHDDNGYTDVEELGRIMDVIWKHSKNNQFTDIFTRYLLDAGKPHLIIEQSINVFYVYGLFQSFGMVPRAEHIVICKSTTLEEEIECLLFRAIIAAKTAINKKAPLYCLMLPENLPEEETAKKVVKLFHLLLLSETALQKLGAIPYSLVIISASPNNALCHTLLPFRFHRPISLFEQTAQSIFSQMYCNDWTSFVAQKDVNKKPFVQLYTSKCVGMGKSYKIRKDCEKASQRVCIAFNSEDIEWKFLVHNFWRYHPSQSDLAIVPNRQISDHDIIAFHLDLSSSISTEINNFLFELLFLQHVNTGQNILECFHVNHNMAFFIEIPSKLSIDKQTPQQLLYTLFGPIAFPILDVNTKNNPYVYGQEAQYALKWIREFNANCLKKYDPNPKNIQDLKLNEIREFIQNKLPVIASSTYLHQTSFFRYCFQQFLPIAQSEYIQNSVWIDGNGSCSNVPFKHMITKSVLQIAEDLSARLFGNTNAKELGDESAGEEEFFPCKKWRDSKDPLFLCNNDEGDKNSEATFSLLISDIEIIAKELLDVFKQLGFLLFDWNDDIQKREDAVERMTESIESDQNKKRERAELLFRVLGVPLALREGIEKELCAGEFAHYVLTFDNILKMVAIAQQIRLDTP